MTPEQKAALMSLLNDAGGSPAGGVHQDAAQDYEQICQVIEQKLTPAFEIIGQELKKLREENDDLKDTLYKLVTAFSDGVSGYKRNGIKSSVLPKYADDLGMYGPMAKDILGADIESELMDALMAGDGDPDEIAGGVIGKYKEKFGKYLGGAPAPGKEVSVEVETSSEPEVQGELGLEEPAEKEEEKASSGKPSDKLFEQLKGLQRKTA